MVGSHHSLVCFCLLAFWESSPPGKPRHLPSCLIPGYQRHKPGVQNSHSGAWFPGSCAQSRYETTSSSFRVHHAKLGQRGGDVSLRPQLSLHLGKDTNTHTQETGTRHAAALVWLCV